MSNHYPSWWNTTITIYNKYEDPLTQVITWYRKVVSGCFWKHSGDRVTIDKIVLDTKNIICRIPINSNFLERHEWESQPNDKMSDYFTLSVGDIIVKGEVSDDINEYQSGYRSSDLLDKYKTQGCLKIEEWSNNTGGGRGNEHYYVRGI